MEQKTAASDPLLAKDGDTPRKKYRGIILTTIMCFLFLASVATIAWLGNVHKFWIKLLPDERNVVHSTKAVVTSDDGRCSDIGVSMMRMGGNAVDAAIATALCIGVVCQTSSGIGGGDFIMVRPAGGKARAFDARETAPAAATEDMYAKNMSEKFWGPKAMAVPGEVAGLYAVWSEYGKLPWSVLFMPSIILASKGFEVSQFLAENLVFMNDSIMKDPGLRSVYAPNEKLLQYGETCYNVKLGQSLTEIAVYGPQALYGGSVGQRLVSDVTQGGGILTIDDLTNYTVRITEPLTVNSLGYTVYGMPPPSAGTVCLAMIMNIFNSYPNPWKAVAGPLGLHRLVEAMKYMFGIRLDLGDPAFVNITEPMSKMLSPAYANYIRTQINDHTTYLPEHYLPKYNPQREGGTSHLCVVDEDRNVVSMTATVNYYFGAGVLSPSTGIVLNNEMDDFATPNDTTPYGLPPAKNNFIQPNKRPLSSMTPIIILKNDELIGVLGGAGGWTITPGVIQVFFNHFLLGMKPAKAMKEARVYPLLSDNLLWYENMTVFNGDHIELSKKKRQFLLERKHNLTVAEVGTICGFVVQKSSNFGRKSNEIKGLLTGVSDIRKGGYPAAL